MIVNAYNCQLLNYECQYHRINLAWWQMYFCRSEIGCGIQMYRAHYSCKLRMFHDGLFQFCNLFYRDCSWHWYDNQNHVMYDIDHSVYIKTPGHKKNQKNFSNQLISSGRAQTMEMIFYLIMCQASIDLNRKYLTIWRENNIILIVWTIKLFPIVQRRWKLVNGETLRSWPWMSRLPVKSLLIVVATWFVVHIMRWSERISDAEPPPIDIWHAQDLVKYHWLVGRLSLYYNFASL